MLPLELRLGIEKNIRILKRSTNSYMKSDFYAGDIERPLPRSY